LFVLATRWIKGEMGEGFAIAVLESAAAKAPVVATASCGVEEIIVNGDTGSIAQVEDPDSPRPWMIPRQRTNERNACTT
jgi:glycosyltransferase involved in cell wall biosynthesis